MNNLKILVTAVISYGVGFSILNGYIPSNYFAGPDNEIGCFVIAFAMGTLSLIALDYKGLYKWLVNK